VFERFRQLLRGKKPACDEHLAELESRQSIDDRLMSRKRAH
jgi:hypothetical protein